MIITIMIMTKIEEKGYSDRYFILYTIAWDAKRKEHVQYFQFLGILFDENLKWKCPYK